MNLLHIIRTTVRQRPWAFLKHQLYPCGAQPHWLEQRRLSDRLLHTGISSRGHYEVDHGEARFPHQEPHSVRPSGGHLVRAPDESGQQCRNSREEGAVRHSKRGWQWVLDLILPHNHCCFNSGFGSSCLNRLSRKTSLLSKQLVNCMAMLICQIKSLLNLPSPRHNCSIAKDCGPQPGSQAGQWRTEDDGHHHMHSGGDLHGLHCSSSIEEEEKRAETQEITRCVDIIDLWSFLLSLFCNSYLPIFS